MYALRPSPIRACQLGEYVRSRFDSEVNVSPKWQKSLQNEIPTIVRYYTKYILILVCNGTIFTLLRILKFGVSGNPGTHLVHSNMH